MIRNVSGACILLRFPAAPNLSFPRFFCGPLEMLSNFIKSCRWKEKMQTTDRGYAFKCNSTWIWKIRTSSPEIPSQTRSLR